MALTIARRRCLRTLAGTLLVSLGTAVFAGAVSIVIDALVKNVSVRWPYLIGSTLLVLALSGAGGWLLGTLRAGRSAAKSKWHQAGTTYF
ncbi:hypothetical protein AB0K60_19230 [Thermopolyspora sp. NPDC052614]|uniref:hypothetical protein n=1 Tax=Thermopolyspora sp. NPDC052614 TaxID=3155682 RepID=UPI0034271CC4